MQTAKQSSLPAQNTDDYQNKRIPFEEVEVRRMPHVREGVPPYVKLITKFERIKTLKPRVLITQAQADILNEGRSSHPDNRYFTMYLLPGQEPEPFIQTIQN